MLAFMPLRVSAAAFGVSLIVFVLVSLLLRSFGYFPAIAGGLVAGLIAYALIAAIKR